MCKLLTRHQDINEDCKNIVFDGGYYIYKY